MILGESPISRISRLADRETGTYHQRLMATLFILRDYWPDDQEYCIEVCYRAAEHCTYRNPNHLEIEKLADFVWNAGSREAKPKAVPVTDHALISEITVDGAMETLKGMSKPHPVSIAKMLDDLFPDDPWLCIARDIFGTEIKRKSDWQKMDLSEYEFLLPNPLKDNTSRKADNILETRYLTYESDQFGQNWDTHASCLLNLSKFIHLQSVCFSGSKSCHGLFRVKGYSQEHIERFRDRVYQLAGDPCTLRKQQFTRLPGGFRKDKNQPQAILFYNV